MSITTETKRILISKSNNLIRVARTDGQKLFALDNEGEHEQKTDSICNAEVISIEPSLEAAFVNFGSKRNGFLPLKEISQEYYPNGQYDRNLSIKDILFIGQKILVQITKEERGTKGAALTTFISLAGSYLVLMPNNSKAGGISRRIEGAERDELREILNALKLPSDMGIIVRTAGMGRALEELQWDLDVLLNLWESIKRASKAYGAPYLIHQESDVTIRSIRDHLRQDISEILIDDKELYEKVLAYIERVRPNFTHCVKYYNEKTPLFSRFQLEKQIETAFQRNVRLPSGGEIVIDYTEALITVDVNSAQATKGGYIEETALHTNLEAADEIAKQLRLRDLGGLIVIDFIDMDREENIRQVEERLREALKTDRARVQMAHISRFGLLEMSRQRLRPSIHETALMPCPRCHGQGSIRNIKSLALSILHLIEENAVQQNTSQIRVQVPIELATFILNEFRSFINSIEQNHQTSIWIIPNPYIETPKYEIECVSGNAKNVSEKTNKSYEFVKTPSLDYQPPMVESPIEKKKPVVSESLPTAPAPIIARKKPSEPEGFFRRLFKKILSPKESSPETTTPQKKGTGSSRNMLRHRHEKIRSFSQKSLRRSRPGSMRRSSETSSRKPAASPHRRSGRPYESSRESSKPSHIVEKYQPSTQSSTKSTAAQTVKPAEPAPKPVEAVTKQTVETPKFVASQTHIEPKKLPEHATKINLESHPHHEEPSDLIMVETKKTEN